MPTVNSPTNRLNGWSGPTLCEMPACLTSRLIPCLEISGANRDTPRFLRKCDCRHNGDSCTRQAYLPVFLQSFNGLKFVALSKQPTFSILLGLHCYFTDELHLMKFLGSEF